MFSKIMTAAGLVSMASAHLLLQDPLPFAVKDNGPLLADGSDFPCKNPDYTATGGGNTFAAGSTQQLGFKGSAVHGGGSCQVSVTKDNPPTKDSVWKVIKSIEGGCPARDTPGNLPENPEGVVPYRYDYQVPEQLAAGDYILAWTWFNKIGNREMYMNCAPLTVTGGGDAGFFDTLPDMFTANIGGDCKTAETVDVEFPNPGEAVEKANGATQAFGPPVGACATGGGGGGGGGPDPTPTPTPTPTSTPGGGPGGVFVPQPTDAPAPPPDAPDSPTGGNPPGTACFEDGAWNCIEGGSFQRCASGVWSPVQPMAEGVDCEAGQSSSLKVNAKSGLRAMRRSLHVR